MECVTKIATCYYMGYATKIINATKIIYATIWYVLQRLPVQSYGMLQSVGQGHIVKFLQ